MHRDLLMGLTPHGSCRYVPRTAAGQGDGRPVRRLQYRHLRHK